MKKILAFIKLIRPFNLLVMVVTMFLMRYCVIKPFMQFSELSLQISRIDFLFMVLSVIFIAASGYVINDYYDIKADKINRPEKIIIGKEISLNWALYLNFTMNAIGILFGLWLAMDIGDWNYAFIFIFTSGILWFYSSSYKAIPLLGNVIISLLVGVVPLLVVLFEMIVFSTHYKAELNAGQINYMPVFYFVLGFAIFAFWMNMIREFVKDIEDVPGDIETNKKTIAVVFGEKFSKILTTIFSAILITGMGYVYIVFMKNWATLAFYIAFMTLPLLFLMYKLWRSTEKKDYHLIQTGLKILMVTGLLYAIIICVDIRS